MGWPSELRVHQLHGSCDPKTLYRAAGLAVEVASGHGPHLSVLDDQGRPIIAPETALDPKDLGALMSTNRRAQEIVDSRQWLHSISSKYPQMRPLTKLWIDTLRERTEAVKAARTQEQEAEQHAAPQASAATAAAEKAEQVAEERVKREINAMRALLHSNFFDQVGGHPTNAWIEWFMSSTGSLWTNVGNEQPMEGVPLEHPALASILANSQVDGIFKLTQEERKTIGLPTVTHNTFIRVRDDYFQPTRYPGEMVTDTAIFPSNMYRVIPDLETLSLQGEAIVDPPDLTGLVRLGKLWLACDNLRAVPDLSHLTQLQLLDLTYCSTIEELPYIGQNVPLSIVILDTCQSLISISTLQPLGSLEFLKVENCNRIQTLPSDFDRWTNLEFLCLQNCVNLNSLPSLDPLTQLETLNVSGCTSLETLPSLSQLTTLIILDTSRCTALRQMNGFPVPAPGPQQQPVQLRMIRMEDCTELRELSTFEHLVQLTELDLSGCTLIRTLPGFSRRTFVNLNILHFDGTWTLTRSD